MVADRLRVQNAVKNLALAGKFPRVKYNERTGDAELIETQLVKPTSCITNEIESSFTVDTDYGRKRRLKRETWTFTLFLNFDTEISLAFFEEAMMEPTVLAADPAKGYTQATIDLVRSFVSHPVQQQSAGGTEARLVFEITVGRA